MSASGLEQALGGFARLTGRFQVWYKLPFGLSLASLLGNRVNMRWGNLFDVEREPSLLKPQGDPTRLDERSPDGSYNDLGCPWMGMAGARFGRNMPIGDTRGETAPDLYDPNPRTVSRKLLARDSFTPVPHLNVMVAAWLQFMVHDWLSHGKNAKEPLHVLPKEADDDWPDPEITVLSTQRDSLLCPGDEGQPACYRNTETHWWDGSQVYGSSRERIELVRTDPNTGQVRPDGKVHLDDNGHLPRLADGPLPGLELAGVNGNWWLGLSMMQTLFAREHNAIVDRLRAEYPHADGEWLFQKARLANAALMAKIHTTEWTPSLMNSPVGRFVMRGSWWGILGEHYARAFGRLSENEVLSGIPGSLPDHFAAPYCMTEEFTAVYRMHSLIPDEFSIRRHTDDAELMRRDFAGVAAAAVGPVYDEASFANVVYSLATSPCGALVLHNFPTGLRRLSKKADDGIFVDLAATDVLRDRERGVPRYCAFRRDLGMSVPKSFDELTSHPEWAAQLKAVYGSVDKVDLLVGMHCETPPDGFGFSDTAFRIFILMAGRRLKSDRFFTSDFRPEVYTPAGYAWVRDNSLRTVLARHVPELAGHFGDARNVFFPWDRRAL
jgi:hypothetical protein